MINVSVIVPVYNSELYLRQCLDSLVNQTLKEIEIILVNDVSTDRSPEIMRQYENEYPNVIVVNHEVNKKPGGARNTGIKTAQGEYIAFVDSDDKVDFTTYEKLYTKAQETNADIVDFDYYNWYPSEQDRLKPRKSDLDICGVLDREKRGRIIIRGAMPIWVKLYRRSLFIENDIYFPENFLYAEDVAAASLLYIYADVSEKVPEHLYYYRHDNISVTRKANNYQGWIDRFEALKIFVDNYKNRGLYQEYKNEVDALFINTFYIESLSLALKNFDYKFHKGMIAYVRKYVKDNYPDYRKNPYFKIKKRNIKTRTLLCDISPMLLFFYEKVRSFFKRIYKAFRFSCFSI